jgi:hypothetical protein
MKAGHFETNPSSIRSSLWSLLSILDDGDSKELREILAGYLRVSKNDIRKDLESLGNTYPEGIDALVDRLWITFIDQRIGWISASDNEVVNGQEMRRAVQHIGAWLDGKLPKYRKR